MRVDVVVPQIGEAIAELHIVTWLKAVGDTISKGDVLFEVDSDKAIVEVEAFVDGTLVEILHDEGSAVMPQDVVAIIETSESNDDTPTVASRAPDTHPTQPTIDEAPALPNGRRVTPVAERIAAELGVSIAQVQGSGPRGRVGVDDVYRHVRESVQRGTVDGHTSQQTVINASPKARRVAREMGVNLVGLHGTGVGGMVVVRDVETVTQSKSTIVTQSDGHGTQTKLRQTVATRTTVSKQTVPHFYLEVDVNMTQVNALRTFCIEQMKWERPPTYTDVLVRACAVMLADMTWANQSYVNQGVVQRSQVHIGVAVGTDGGLLVPVLPNADSLSLRQASDNLRAMIGRAREGRLKPADMGDKSMVISNLGMFTVDRFAAIIDMPDPMILAVGRVAERVVALNGQVTIQPMCTLTLSVDHRVFDGVQGARILERIKAILENPFEILG